MKKYIIYKTTNLINNKIYIGKHETEDRDDDYLGSGKMLNYAIEKYGRDKFKKEILYEFDNEEEMNEMEKRVVDEEFIERNDTYNMKLGGKGGWVLRKDLVVVKDKDENTYVVYKNDPRYLSGKLKFIFSDLVFVKDKDDNIFQISKNDPRYLSGELKFIWKGWEHTEETKRKIGEANAINQLGERNSQYGTCWIHNSEEKISRKIKKEDLEEWVSKGWIKGRKIKW